jgi:hypothetical protein
LFVGNLERLLEIGALAKPLLTLAPIVIRGIAPPVADVDGLFNTKLPPSFLGVAIGFFNGVSFATALPGLGVSILDEDLISKGTLFLRVVLAIGDISFRPVLEIKKILSLGAKPHCNKEKTYLDW